MVAAAVVGSAVVGSVASRQAAKSANNAANAQVAAADRGAATEEERFQQVVELLSPYRQAGEKSLAGQQDLLGLNGGTQQQQAINALQNGPQFQSLLRQGENSILSNASATGGLRGGNTQAALAQFSPQLLTQLINDQYANLGGITAIGQNAAAGTGNAGIQTGSNIAALQQQAGAAQAGGILGQGAARQGFYNNISQGIGMLGGGFGSAAPAASGTSYFGGLKGAF